MNQYRIGYPHHMVISAERTFRERMLRVTTAMLIVFGALTALRYLQIGIPWMALADFAAIGIALANLAVLRDRIELAGHVFVSTLLAVLILDNTTTGGYLDPNFCWLYVVPVAGGFLVSGRAAVGYGLVVAGVTLAFFLVDQLGPGVPDLVAPEDHASQTLFNHLTEIGALVGIVVAFGHERGRSSVALAEALQAANAANHAKSEFLANMSHELRTPLTAIIGFAELLIEEADDEDRRSAVRDLTRIRLSARGLLSLINEVLDLSKIEAGKLAIVPAPTDLRQVLLDVGSNLGDLVRQGGNQWEVDLPVDLGTATLDGQRLAQIVTNLVGNSAKFTRDGVVRLVATREGTWLRISVQDTGIGIPTHLQERVFESFVQADSSATRTVGGTGLGLAIARRLARMMGGDLVLTSAPGEGSIFTVTVAAG